MKEVARLTNGAWAENELDNGAQILSERVRVIDGKKKNSGEGLRFHGATEIDSISAYD